MPSFPRSPADAAAGPAAPPIAGDNAQCPAGGIEDYTDEGRPAEFNAVCDGTPAKNGFYGEGIVNALAAVQ